MSNTITIKLSGKLGGETMVDAEDYEYLNQWKWKNQGGRAARTKHIGTVGDWREGKRKDRTIHMHRLIMDAPDNMDVDHINGNPLDNSKSNLRICTHQENRSNTKVPINNTSGYKGVYWHKQRFKWCTQITFMNKTYTLALFESPIEAAREYDYVAKQLFGEFARLNFGEIL